MQAACPEETPITPPGRLEAMEKRLQAMIDAAKTVKPALESFYGSLSNEQKALQPHRRPTRANRRLSVGALKMTRAATGPPFFLSLFTLPWREVKKITPPRSSPQAPPP